MKDNNKSEVERLERLGYFFQFPMIVSFVVCASAFFYPDRPWWSMGIGYLGIGIATYCLFVLYIKNKKERGLVRSFPFNLTRHPMYTGILLADIPMWTPYFPQESIFFAFQAIFLVSLLVAGYIQEKETLARFGKEAEEYYRRTPRLFLLYPFYLIENFKTGGSF